MCLEDSAYLCGLKVCHLYTGNRERLTLSFNFNLSVFKNGTPCEMHGARALARTKVQSPKRSGIYYSAHDSARYYMNLLHM